MIRNAGDYLCLKVMANVNMDIPEWNNVKPDETLGNGPAQLHICYQTPRKGKERVRGHIFVDDVPATRR